jgi:2-oxo-3-hexenedioate decarboxylase
MTAASTLNSREIARLAHALDEAQSCGRDLVSLAQTVDMGAADAYRIQDALLERRLSRGERLTGLKLGFTSEEKMRQMGVADVIVGRLTDEMRVDSGGQLRLDRFIHPKAEPEVAYRLSHDVDLDAPQINIEQCIDAVAPAIEIIDSRYRDFRFTYTDVIADNTSAAAYVIGKWQEVRSVAGLAVRIEVGDQSTAGSTSAILGDPIRALHRLLDMCRRTRMPMRAGHVVLAGAATAAIPLTAGIVRCEIEGLGEAHLRTVA